MPFVCVCGKRLVRACVLSFRGVFRKFSERWSTILGGQVLDSIWLSVSFMILSVSLWFD